MKKEIKNYMPKRSAFDPLYQTENLDSKVVVALERLSAAFRVELWRKNKETSLSPIQIQILIFLLFHDEDKRTVSMLADEMNVTKATISAAVSTLVEKGLIEKSSHSRDHRIMPLFLTPRGKEMAENASDFSDNIVNQIGFIPEDRKRVLYETLLGTIMRLQQNGVISLSRMCYGCKFFSEGQDRHYCNLLKKPLENHEIRIDCPEHVTKKVNLS